MQRAHILVASCDGTKLVKAFQSYCQSKKVSAKYAELIPCLQAGGFDQTSWHSKRTLL